MTTLEELEKRIKALEEQHPKDIAIARTETRELAIDLEKRVPSGTVFLYAGSKAPEGFLVCDGSTVERLKFSDLFNVIGTTYGEGDGSTTFNLPDLRGRAAIGAGSSPELSARSLGQQLGSETHTLNSAEIPKHTHSSTTENGGNHNHTGSIAESGSHAHSGTTANAGNHNHSGVTAGANAKFHRDVGSVGTDSLRNHQACWRGTGNFVDRTDNNFANADHTHNFGTNTTGNHGHNFSTNNTGNHAHNLSIDSAGQHQHNLTTDGGIGEGKAHNNMQPSLVLNYIIKI